MANKKEVPGLKFYEYSQNNTGGSFVTDDKLCHKLFIEANNSEEADSIAEELGCYWDGVHNGYDCECCGDRWYSGHEVNIMTRGGEKNGSYPVDLWVDRKKSPDSALTELKERYSGYEWIEEPWLLEKYGSPVIAGRVKLNSIEQYAQITSDQYGWTYPDARIFYHDGTIKEIFSCKIEAPKKKRQKNKNTIS